MSRALDHITLFQPHLDALEAPIGALASKARDPRAASLKKGASAHTELAHKAYRAQVQDEADALVAQLLALCPASWSTQRWALRILADGKRASWKTNTFDPTGTHTQTVALTTGGLGAWAGQIVGAALLDQEHDAGAQPHPLLWRFAPATAAPSRPLLAFEPQTFGDTSPMRALAKATAMGFFKAATPLATSLHGAFFAHAAFAKSTHTRCVWTQAPGLLHALAHHPITTNLPGFALKGQNSDYMLQANPSLNAYGTPAQQLERIAAFEQGCRTLLAALDTIALPAPGAPISTWVHDPNGVSITSMYRPSASAWSIQAAAASIAMGSIGLSDTPPDNPFDLVPNLHRI